MPFLKKKINSYKKFSKVRNINSLVGKRKEDVYQTKKITEGRSLVFIQDEQGFNAIPLPNETQLSSVEDFFWDEKTKKLFYVGNYSYNITQLGSNNSNSGGVLSDWNPDSNTFENHDFMEISSRIEARAIEKLNEEIMLIGANNDFIYLIEK